MKGWDAVHTGDAMRLVDPVARVAEADPEPASRWTWLQYGLAAAAAVPLLFVGGLDKWPGQADAGAPVVPVAAVDRHEPERVQYPRQAQLGDRITITDADGSTSTFVLAEVTTYRASELPGGYGYGGDRRSAELRLIAPAGRPDASRRYPGRLVVWAEQLD